MNVKSRTDVVFHIENKYETIRLMAEIGFPPESLT
jgi:hypothetical protein